MHGKVPYWPARSAKHRYVLHNVFITYFSIFITMRGGRMYHGTGHVRRRRPTSCHPQCVHFVRNTQNVNKRKYINSPIIQCHIPLNNTLVLLSRVPNHPVKSSATLQSGSDARQYRSYGHSVSTTAKTYDTPLLSRPRLSRGTVRSLNSIFHMGSPD